MWDTDVATGGLVPSVSVTSFGGEAEAWLEVSVRGLGSEFGFSMGPYPSQLEPFSVPIPLPVEASASGLAQVFVTMIATDPEGDVRAVEQAPVAYVIDVATATERWFDEATAEAAAVRALPVALADDTILEGVVGLEVTP